MKVRRINRILLILCLTLLLSACSSVGKDVVLKVNGKDISKEEFDIRFNMIVDSYKRQFGEDFIKQKLDDGKTREDRLREDLLEELILMEIIKKEAEGKNIIVEEEEIDEKLKEVEKGLGGEEALKEYIKERDMTIESLRETLKKPLLVEKFEEYEKSQVKISENEIEDYFNKNKDNLIEVKARHILLSSEEEAEEVLKKLDEGEDFAKLAKDRSIHYISARNGGDLGYFSKGEWIKDFEDQVFQLEEGEISGIIKTEIGYHIVLIDDRKDDLESLRDKIINKLRDERYLKMIQEKRKNAKVKIYDQGK